MLLSICVALSSCGWKGEPVPVYDEDSGVDTVVNDYSYIVVTGNISSVSAVAVDLNGYVNSTSLVKDDFREFGFLISRFVEKPILPNVADSEPLSHNRVRKIVCEESEDDHSVKIRVGGLIPATKFYYRAYAVQNNGEVLYGVTKKFMTIDLKLTLYPPRRVGITDAELEARLDGLGGEDYGPDVFMSFICRDIPTITEKSDTMTYDQILPAYEGPTKHVWRATFTDLTPGRRYYNHAFMTIRSEFYDYGLDNPFYEATGEYLYGTQPSDVESFKYVSLVESFSSNALMGIKSFNSTDVVYDYDVVDINDCYFFIPNDTLRVMEYGVALIFQEEDGSRRYDYYPSSDELAQGNRYSTRITNLELNTHYLYTAYVVVEGRTFLSVDERSFTTKNYTPEFVDLGLSVLWADRNIGAYAPEIAGTYYAWGELDPKKTYLDENYSGPESSLADIAGTSYDVATQKWGGQWRLPTKAQVDELFDECTWKWVYVGDMPGFLITGPNENTIFLPAGGMRTGTGLQDFGRYGYFWTSQRDAGKDGYVHDVYIVRGLTANESQRPVRSSIPSLGLSIRPVRLR